MKGTISKKTKDRIRIDPKLPEGNDSITMSFVSFHRANPEIYFRLREMALKLKRKGHEHWCIAGLFEVLRWDIAVETAHDEDGFKLNSNHRALYARMLMLNEPMLEGFFRTRKTANDLKHEDEPAFYDDEDDDED